MKLTIAFLQLLPTGYLNGNMEKGINACIQAKEKGADIAVFPEMWSCGYAFPHDETSLRQTAISTDSFFMKQFSGLAAELDMAIAITLLEQHEPKPRNTVCLFDRHGKLNIDIPKSISVILERRMTKESWTPVMPFVLQTWTQKTES